MDSWIHLLTKKIPAYGFPCVFADKAACLYFILKHVLLTDSDDAGLFLYVHLYLLLHAPHSLT